MGLVGIFFCGAGLKSTHGICTGIQVIDFRLAPLPHFIAPQNFFQQMYAIEMYGEAGFSDSGQSLRTSYCPRLNQFGTVQSWG